jgi:hypothetical protein
MVNATQMCLAGGKFYAHYNTTAEMIEFVQTLSLNIGIPIFDLVRTKPGHNGGTMVHRRVAMYLAQRISPLFNVQVTGNLDELLLTGRVELGKKKTPEELDAIWKSRIAEEQANIQADYLREKLSKELYLLSNKKLFVFFLTGACIYFKNKNDSDSNERVATTTARNSSSFKCRIGPQGRYRRLCFPSAYNRRIA